MQFIKKLFDHIPLLTASKRERTTETTPRKYIKEVRLFDDQCSIQLVDFAAMGNRGYYAGDLATVDGARVSFGRRSSEFPFEKNEGLARDLWKALDSSPFRHFVGQFRARIPIHIALEWFMFRLAAYSEISGRYTMSLSHLDRCFIPPGLDLELAEMLRRDFVKSHVFYRQLYNPDGFKRGEKQVAKELARSALLYSFLTEFIWTVDLRKIIHFLMSIAANPLFDEVRTALLKLLEEHVPINKDAFVEAIVKSANEKEPLREPAHYSFSPCETGVIPGEDFSALKLIKVIGSDAQLAETIRYSRGYTGTDKQIIAKLIKGAHRDDIPEELSIIGLQVAIRAPVYVFRQMYRHQRPSWFGLRVIHDRFYVPQEWRAQTEDSRYVFTPFSEQENKTFTDRFSDYLAERITRFTNLLHCGVPLSLAERYLPYCFYIFAFRNGDGVDLFNMLNLRADWHTQAEHRPFSLQMAAWARQHFPDTFRAWYELYWRGRDDPRNETVLQIYKHLM